MNGEAAGRFTAAIKRENSLGRVAVIPDIKCTSPKEGDLMRGRDPVDVAKLLVRCGAPVLSVVTEKERFKGSPGLLRSIADSTGVPVLRKDFITDESLLKETVETGASAVLLICATTEKKTLAKLYEKTLKLNLEPLVEVCSKEEMSFATSIGARLIGINNRNIITLERDNGGPSRTAALASGKPRDALLISESGILSPDDAKLAVSSGANAVLVGTALLQSEDIEAMYRSLRVEWKDITCVQL